jgi:L-ascorbate metabolism protein UlaG (beta-lactamase superfamily)
MRKIIISAALCIFATSFTYAQHKTADTIATSSGSIIIQPVQHATFVITADNKTIYVDPTGGAEAFQGIKPPDIILITDIHGDHMDPKTLEAVTKSNTVTVVPQAVADKLPITDKSRLLVLKNGDQDEQHGLSIKAVPMYNLPEAADSRHTKGRGNGYVLNIAGKNIYISGDTEDIPEMRALKDIDMAFVCMNLPYTMDINQAAKAVLEFRPKIVYPYHYRGQNGLSDVNAFKQLVNDGSKQTEVRLLNWYPTR